MRIYSKFKDLYDNTHSWDTSDDFKWIREQQTFEENSLLKSDIDNIKKLFEHSIYLVFPEKRSRISIRSDFKTGFLLFCGEVFPYKYFENNFFYNLNQFKEWYRIEYGKEYQQLHKEDSVLYSLLNKSKDFEQWKSRCDSLIKDCSLFLTLKAPIVNIGKNNEHKIVLTTNISLQSISFYSNMAPFTVYERIDRFLQNELANQKQIEEIPNNYKILKAGFDLKKSFRNC